MARKRYYMRDYELKFITPAERSEMECHCENSECEICVPMNCFYIQLGE